MRRWRWRALATSGVAALLLATNTTTASAAVDTAPPDLPTITGPSGRVASTSADISVTRADPADTVVRFANGVEVNCPGSWTITGLDQGAHAVTATFYDAGLNESETVYVYWVGDTVGPLGTTIAPSGLTTDATVSFDEAVSGVTSDSVRLATDAGSAVPHTRACHTGTTPSPTCLARRPRWRSAGRPSRCTPPSAQASVKQRSTSTVNWPRAPTSTPQRWRSASR